MNPAPLIPNNFPEHKPTEYGKHIVIRKDGKCHFEVWNNTSWAYNNNSIIAFYLPKIS